MNNPYMQQLIPQMNYVPPQINKTISNIQKIHVSNLPLNVSQHQLQQAFQHYGQIIDIRIIKKTPTGLPLNSTCYCFIAFAAAESAERAIQDGQLGTWVVKPQIDKKQETQQKFRSRSRSRSNERPHHKETHLQTYPNTFQMKSQNDISNTTHRQTYQTDDSIFKQCAPVDFNNTNNQQQQKPIYINFGNNNNQSDLLSQLAIQPQIMQQLKPPIMPFQSLYPVNPVQQNIDIASSFINLQDRKDTVKREQTIFWSGFMLRSRSHKVAVDAKSIEQDVQINTNQPQISIPHQIPVNYKGNYSDAVKVAKECIKFTICPTDSSQNTAFQEYLDYFKEKNKIGVAQIADGILYLLPPHEITNSIQKICELEILVLFAGEKKRQSE